MQLNLITGQFTPPIAAVPVASHCSTMEQVAISITASLMPDLDLVPGHPDCHQEVAVQRIAYELGLNPEQVAKLRAVESELVAIWREDRAEQNKLIAAWLEELGSAPTDKACLQALIEERERLWEGYAPRVLDRVVDFHASLGDNQKRRLKSRTGEKHPWQASG